MQETSDEKSWCRGRGLSLLFAALAFALAACGGGDEVDEFYDSFNTVLHEACTCAEMIGDETYDECTSGPDTFTDRDRDCLEQVSVRYPDEVAATAGCAADALREMASCVRSQECGSPEYSACLNLEERLSVCPELPEMAQAELSACGGP